MQVILLKDVAGLGRRHDVKEVSDGFARNQLIPRGDATLATPKALSALLVRKESVADTKRLEHSLRDKNIASLKEKTIALSRKANEKGHLFAKIKAQDIADAVREQLRIEIPVSTIILEKQIGTTGTHHVLLKSDGVQAEITLQVQE